ncbi:IPT/TIG domain-containing protein [Labilibacter marinus]|uniref:IPT/TIG domain-containing protein n=1 Tax=Labilibacter marinus TaxID=1477105 RepID=UPI00094FE466|nr:IPT/TIG domain-containing protein [Labilibacter marinus]
MKNILKYSLFSLLIGLLVFTTGCEEKELSQDYDINWPIPELTEISVSGDVAIGSQITVKGAHFADAVVTINGTECKVINVNGTETEMSVELPRIFEQGLLRVANVFSRYSESDELLNPVYPEVTVTKVNDIPQGLQFKVEGENVDVITEVYIDGESVPILTRKPSEILINSGEVDLKPGQLVTVSFKSLGPNAIPEVPNVNVTYPFIEYKELIIWDFEDGNHLYVGEPTATVEAGGSDCPGNVDKFFQLRAPGYGWDKATGEMTSDEVPDVSTFVNPYLTFVVRTPVGSAGYFQMEDQNGNWRHFNYGFRTEGEWMIISQPLNEGWEGGEFDARAFKPKLGFKAGNAGTQQDVDIAYMKITEGMYDGVLEPGDPIGSTDIPAKIDLLTFEDTENHPDQVNNDITIGSLDNTLRPAADQISAFNGSHFYTFGNDPAAGGWGGYWGNTISVDTKTTDLSKFKDPYLSMALNTGKGLGQQYIIVRMYQYDEQLVMVRKFFPNNDGLWTNHQFSLFNEDLENWSDDSTELGAHYKTLKRMNPAEAIDRVEIIVSRNDQNEVLISMDEFSITEGPRY